MLVPLSLSPSITHSHTHTHTQIDFGLTYPTCSHLPPPFPGGYYACNKYLKGVAEGTLEGEAKSAHAAEAANLAWQKEGKDCHHPTALSAVPYSGVAQFVAPIALCSFNRLTVPNSITAVIH
jgi:hypothetical protein